ncbi:MAG: hypothetical protein K8T25_23785 [Planctomycetia bacterium]|nr:hypothetical protein [Planctomycetia bacterium]
MEADSAKTLQRYKRACVLLLFVVSLLVLILLVELFFTTRASNRVDERLIGTWQSDADRTIAEMRERRPVDAKQEAGLRTILGKFRITYAGNTLTTEFDGRRNTSRYEVVGRDKVSTVIHELDTAKPVIPIEMSEYAILEFDGPNAYWVHSKMGGGRECFKRVK